MLRLSFIVPFYNVEQYIEECIRSLYNQDIPQEEYEVICVDDCSPDGSRAIVERLQGEYSTLKLICHTENKRQGGARNTGIREAKGKYVWFVDSDDYIKPNCLKNLLELAESENLDLLKFYEEHISLQNFNRKIVTTPVMSGTELIFDVDTGEEPMLKCCTVWCQLIKMDLIIDHKIFFAENVQYEDDDYAYQLFAYADRTCLMDFSPYIVRQTPNSTTRRQHDLRRVQDIYAQAIRMQRLDSKLSACDGRWHKMIVECIDDCINNCVLRMLKSCSLLDQTHFFLHDRKGIRYLKPYLTRKSYLKLNSFLMWKLLQK